MALAAIAFDVSRLGLLTATKTPLAEASSVGTVAGDWAWLDSAEICVGVKGDHNRAMTKHGRDGLPSRPVLIPVRCGSGCQKDVGVGSS
jgi:hypothetical protein